MNLHNHSSHTTIVHSLQRTISIQKLKKQLLHKGESRNQYSKRLSQYNSLEINSNDNNSSLDFNNECPGGDSCINLLQIQRLLTKINKLKAKIRDITKLNSFFVFTLNQKNNMYKTLFEENNAIKKSLKSKEHHSSFIPQIINQCQPIPSSMPMTEKPILKKSNLCSSTVNNLNKSEIKNRIPYSSAQIISYFQKDQQNNKQMSPILHSNHYDEVIKLSHKTSKHQFQRTTISFLSMTIDQIKAIENTENMEFIKSLIQSEDYFVSKLKNEKDEFLIDFNESLRTLMKDYIQLLKLITRIRQFHQCGVDLVYTLFNSKTPQVLLDNTCKLLECERAMLYIHEPISDLLEGYSSATTKRNHFKLSKTKGIIGMVYSKGEKIKIDDTALDVRFKNEDELKEKGYRIRNLFCYPLIDINGSTFGVLEGINKKGRFFSSDDEEFMVLLSKISSVVLHNKKNTDQNLRQIERLEKIIKFSNDIRGIQDRYKLMEITESVLASLFTSGSALFVFVSDGIIKHYSRKFPSIDKIGIINLVIKKKECHGCNKARRCKYYNTLVDLEASDSLITYPIMYNDECLAVAQISLRERISEITLKPKENDMKLLGLIKSCIIEWHLDNKISPSITQINDEVINC